MENKDLNLWGGDFSGLHFRAFSPQKQCPISLKCEREEKSSHAEVSGRWEGQETLRVSKSGGGSRSGAKNSRTHMCGSGMWNTEAERSGHSDRAPNL